MTNATIGLSRINPPKINQKGIKRIRRYSGVFLFVVVTFVSIDLWMVNWPITVFLGLTLEELTLEGLTLEGLTLEGLTLEELTLEELTLEELTLEGPTLERPNKKVQREYGAVAPYFIHICDICNN